MKITKTIFSTPIGDFAIPTSLQGKLSLKDNVLHEDIYHELPPIVWAKLPTDITKIFNHDLHQEQQCWAAAFAQIGRTKYDALEKEFKQKLASLINAKTNEEKKKLGLETKQADEALKKFIDNTYRRMREGVWFMNNGFPTYIVGYHFIELCFWKTTTVFGVGYKTYRDKDRRIWFVDKFCENDRNSFGLIYMKGRRDGSTSKSCVKMYLTASTDKGKYSGLQSQNDDQSEKIFKNHIVTPYRSLPDFLRPKDDGQENPKSSINFTQPSVRKGNSNKKHIDSFILNTDDEDSYLESSITYKPTNEGAYDGELLHCYLLDEAAKLVLKDVNKIWQIVKRCLAMGRKIVGKAWVTSTVGENGKGGTNFAKLWGDSCYNERDDNNRTLSGLYRLFLAAYDGYAGFIDKYGYSVIHTPEQPIMGEDGEMIEMGAYEYLSNERKAIKEKGDNKMLASHKRLHPFTEVDALKSDPNESLFDTEALQDQIDSIVEKDEIRQGNFVYDEESKKVSFVDSPQGRFLATQVFSPQEMNNYSFAHSKRDINSAGQSVIIELYKPNNKVKFVIGGDPIDNKFKSDDDSKRSKAAAYVFWKFDISNPQASYAPIVEYIEKPDNILTYYKDMLNLCRYFGCQIQVENQKARGLFNYFIDNGYELFLMDRPEATKTTYTTNTDAYGTPASEGLNNYIVDLIDAYLQENMHKIKFKRLLTQLQGFDLDKTKKFDAVMAWGHTLIGTLKKDKAPTALDKLTKLFKTYNN